MSDVSLKPFSPEHTYGTHERTNERWLNKAKKLHKRKFKSANRSHKHVRVSNSQGEEIHPWLCPHSGKKSMNFRPSLFWEKFKEATPGISSNMRRGHGPRRPARGKRGKTGGKTEKQTKNKAKDEKHIKRRKAEEKRNTGRKRTKRRKTEQSKGKREKNAKGTKRPKKEQKE